MTTNGGATWGPKVSTAPIKHTVVPVANGLAGSASDVVYSVWMDEGPDTAHDNWSIYVDQFSGRVADDARGVIQIDRPARHSRP